MKNQIATIEIVSFTFLFDLKFNQIILKFFGFFYLQVIVQYLLLNFWGKLVMVVINKVFLI